MRTPFYRHVLVSVVATTRQIWRMRLELWSMTRSVAAERRRAIIDRLFDDVRELDAEIASLIEHRIVNGKTSYVENRLSVDWWKATAFVIASALMRVCQIVSASS